MFLFIFDQHKDLKTKGLNSSAVCSGERLGENYTSSHIEHFRTSRARLQPFRTAYLEAVLFAQGSDDTAPPGRWSTARLRFGPGPDLLKPSGRLCTLQPPQRGSYWKTWPILFSILRAGDTESFSCHFPAIEEQDNGCSFRAYLADSFLLSSICCLTLFSLLC